jgi:integrase/recombinase XerD
LLSAFPQWVRAKLPTVWSEEQIESIIHAVDTTTATGKRDYAIVLMGARLGLRIGDMLNLTMNDIDWENKLISIIQGKTKEPLTLPLPDDVGWALINYLKNGRPETDCPNIFVVHNAPYKGSPFKSTLRHNISKILKRAGISVDRSRHYGWHSLRHSDPQVAKHYLRVDLDGLAKCALEVEVMDYVRQ